jgi:hypothetical protein
MYISPDPLPAFRGERGTFQKRDEIKRKDNIKKIRELYAEHRFRQCAALCDTALSGKQVKSSLLESSSQLTNQPHHLHETFLHFYEAICRESLGFVAHTYSNNKLPFLNQARHHFSAALASLPLPFCTTGLGTYDCIDESPQLTVIPPSPSSIYDPTSPTPLPQLKILDTVSEAISDEDSEDGSYSSSVPDFDNYTSRNLNIAIGSMDDPFSPEKLTLDQRKRLCQSLSVGHVVQEDLLPKPLFAKKKTVSLSPPPAPRALPPIPTHDPVLRKTALQTLLNPSVFAILESSPITPRFAQIHSTFDPKFSQLAHDMHMQKYNRLLSSFRTQLLRHIAAVDENIEKVTHLQFERQRNRTSKLASFWSIKAEDVEVREKKERIERLRKGGWDVRKERHGWKGREYYEELRAGALADVDC